MFKINGVEWNIEFINPNDELLIRSDGSSTIGMTDWETKTIYLADNLYGYKLKKVLCHEMCHALIMSLGIYMDIYQEEALADFVATYGKQILHLTKEMIERIR